MGGLLDKKIFKIATGAITGDYGKVIGTVAKGLGLKSEKEVTDIVGTAEKAKQVLNVVTGNAAETLKQDKEFQLQMAQLEMQKMDNFYDAMVEYEGAAKDVHPVVQIMRGLVRPTITWICVLATITCIGFGISDNKPVNEMIPQVLAYMDYMVLGFWFGERSVGRVLDVYKNGREPK